MTAIVALFNRTGEPVDRALLRRMTATLAHRGADGENTRVADNIGMGAQMFWTTPEDVDVHQPVRVDGTPYWLLMDGRIDNRAGLASLLHFSHQQVRDLSDGELMLRAYLRWGEQFVDHILGPFACIIADPVRQSLLCCRDALGARTLYYYLDSHCLVIASEEQALLAHSSVGAELDELTMARYFTIREPSPGHTFFRDVRELPPATALAVTRENVTSWQTWQLTPKRIRYRTDAEYAEHYRALLIESVRCRMRSPSPPAVQMSGGLDSTSVAAVASMLLAASDYRRRLNVVSYVFEDVAAVDESRNIDAVVAHLPLNSLRFNGDDCWPRHNLKTWPQNPNRPDINMYRLLAQSCYRIARMTGSRTIFTGAESDNHYTGSTEWLYDLLRDGKLRDAAVELLRFASPVRRRRAEPYLLYLSLRRLAGHAISNLRGQLPRHAHFTSEEYPWLTTLALDLLNDSVDKSTAETGPASLQRQGVFTSGIKWLIANERFFASLEGVEVRRPYYDRRLVEFMLGVPAYQLYNYGYMKYILRVAMRGRLPEVVRGQTRRTVYSPLYQVALAREQHRLDAVVEGESGSWTPYLRREWMQMQLPKQPSITRASRSAYLVGDWCLALDAWARKQAKPVS